MRLLALLLLSGCAVINPDYYRDMPTSQICVGLMTYPSYNVNHPARYRELARRGESCGTPAEIAAGQRSATDSNLRSAVPLLVAPPTPAPIRCHTDYCF